MGDVMDYETRINSKWCLYCKEARYFRTVDELHQHYHTAHPKSKKWIHECGTCGNLFPDLSLLDFHVNRLHYREIPFECVGLAYGDREFGGTSMAFHPATPSEFHLLLRNGYLPPVGLVVPDLPNDFPVGYAVASVARAELARLEKRVRSYNVWWRRLLRKLCFNPHNV